MGFQQVSTGCVRAWWVLASVNGSWLISANLGLFRRVLANIGGSRRFLTLLDGSQLVFAGLCGYSGFCWVWVGPADSQCLVMHLSISRLALVGFCGSLGFG